MNRTQKMFLYILLIVVLVVGGSVAFAKYKYGFLENTPVATTTPQNAGNYICQQDAKICPDGSSVGRVGPDCSFASCPGATSTIATSSAATNASSTTKSTGSSLSPTISSKYTGRLIGGSLSTSPIFEFEQGDYMRAIAGGKLVVLFFYSNWDTFSQSEFESMHSAFATLPIGAVGFRVNFADNSTSADERLIAKQFKVTNVRSKLLIKKETVLIATSSPWTTNDFGVEIRARM